MLSVESIDEVEKVPVWNLASYDKVRSCSFLPCWCCNNTLDSLLDYWKLLVIDEGTMAGIENFEFLLKL